MVKIPKSITFALLVILFLSLLTNILLVRQNIERNRVVKVVDGDSFQLADQRRVRLLGIDTPEKGRCLFEAAQERLIQLLLDKRVKLTDAVTDDYGRLLANVWVNNNLLINKILVEEGLARFAYVTSPYYEEIKAAANMAKSQKIGIYSQMCLSPVPKNDCIIKANTNSKGEKIYHLPACPNYNQVLIDEAFGDVWFCTEFEATVAGFRKAEGC